MIKWKQAQMDLADFGLDIGNPDFVRYAESYGAFGHRLTSATGLLALLTDCFATAGLHVIAAPIDSLDNDRILNREIKVKSRLL